MDSSKERKIIQKKLESNLFSFTNENECDFAVRRVGGLAGKIFKEFKQYKPASHYYIKSLIDKTILFDLITNCFDSLNLKSKNTVGNPSLSKGEFINIIEKLYKK